MIAAPTLHDSLQLVANGTADATLDARIVGAKNIRDDRLDNIQIVNVVVPEFAQRLHIGLHKNDPRLHAINDGLARLHTNGIYDRIHEKWVGPLQPHRVRLRDLQPYLFPALLTLAAIVSALIWQRRLLRRLARQATELRESKEQLTLVLEGSEDGFWDWDLGPDGSSAANAGPRCSDTPSRKSNRRSTAG